MLLVKTTPNLFRYYLNKHLVNFTSKMLLRINKFCTIISPIRYFSNVPLTRETHKNISKKQFKTPCEKDINFFRSVLDKNRVLTDLSDVSGYNVDWMKQFRGESQIVLKPKTTEEISAILKYCNEKLLAVVPQGGNTGLVGGSVPIFDEVIISTSLMNKIHSIDDVAGNVVCQAGVVLEKLESEVNKYNLCIPLDLGAKGSCQIGGNLSTNAGGIRFLRYGSLHGNVLGLRAVLPDGEILDCLTSLRKDSTGYDLKHLFIGAEGTLGIITDVSLICPSKSESVNVGYFGCSTFDDVLETFKIAKLKLGEILSAFELIDHSSITCVTENLKLKSPLESQHNFYVLVETSGSNQDHDQEKLNNFLTDTMEKGCVKDGILAQDMNQIKKIWEIRENVLVALAEMPYWYFDDISMSLKFMKDFLNILKNPPKDWQDAAIQISFFGHMGDGNLHLNLVTPKYCSDFNKKLETFVYTWIRDHRGSISAEHGLGIKKSEYLHYSKSKEAIKYMNLIKKLFDPKGIMNPYKYLPN